jgi:outer membrane lipoprotein SlyB
MRRCPFLVTSIFPVVLLLDTGTAFSQAPTVDYGVVTGVEQIDLGGKRSGNTTATVAGALAGGAVGYVFGKGSTKGKKRRGILGGTAVGGFIGNQATKGTNKGFQYTVRLVDGENVTITTEQGRINTGDCVTIERGESANIRRVSEVHCQSKDAQPTTEHVAEAKECEAAKAAMLEADTNEALEKAVKEARILCEE